MAAETALRLRLFMALCVMLSALLMSALMLESVAVRVLLMRTETTPVFLPTLDMAMFRAPQKTENDDNIDASAGQPRPVMRLVETLPVGDFALQSALQATHEALLNHTLLATESIYISAMYWNLLGKEDHKLYPDADMTRFGADRGQQLFEALNATLARGVRLRIITAGDSDGLLPEELRTLMNTGQDRVEIHQWSGPNWYGGGILHQKLWIFDHKHVYVGSANMDWKSLAQVMEVGVMLENLPPKSRVMDDIQRLFDVWWHWCELTDSTAIYYSSRFEASLMVPAWSSHVPAHDRAKDPFVNFNLTAHGDVENQLKAVFEDDAAGGTYSQLFVASSPIESTVQRSRTFDEDALLYTIRSATKRVSLSVMDFTPYSMYGLETHANASIWWPALTDALLAAVYAKPGLTVRLLISQWQHSHRAMFDALQALEQQADLCKKQIRCGPGSSLEIKVFRVPGWQNTTSSGGSKPLWPAYTRVNHAKYIVSDKRVNIGTSNMEWGYFYTTAGISVNTDHAATRAAMEGVFDRNWQSDYAVPLSSV